MINTAAVTKLEIPCALSMPERRALVALCCGVNVVECGALLGGSTSIIAGVCHQVISVDKHQGYGPTTLTQFLSNMYIRQGLRDRVIPVVGDAVRLLPNLSGDVYFIDLNGTYETTLAVLEAIPARRPVAIHDFRRQSCAGVEKAVLAAGYEIDHVVDTLALIRRR